MQLALIDNARADGAAFSNGDMADGVVYVGLVEELARDWFTFVGAEISKGATIESAYLKLHTVALEAPGTIDTDICAAAQDNAPVPINDTAAYSDIRTTAKVRFSLTATDAPNKDVTSPDIKTVIQELVNRDGWASGNNIRIHVDAVEGTAGVMGVGSRESGTAPVLIINLASGTVVLQVFDEFEGGEDMERTRQIGKIGKDYESITVSSTAVGLTAEKIASHNGAFITTETAEVRYRIDGGDPEAAVGHALAAGASYTIYSNEGLKQFKAIRTTGDAVLRVTYWDWAGK